MTSHRFDLGKVCFIVIMQTHEVSLPQLLPLSSVTIYVELYHDALVLKFREPGRTNALLVRAKYCHAVCVLRGGR